MLEGGCHLDQILPAGIVSFLAANASRPDSFESRCRELRLWDRRVARDSSCHLPAWCVVNPRVNSVSGSSSSLQQWWWVSIVHEVSSAVRSFKERMNASSSRLVSAMFVPGLLRKDWTCLCCDKAISQPAYEIVKACHQANAILFHVDLGGEDLAFSCVFRKGASFSVQVHVGPWAGHGGSCLSFDR